jgi:hypothetical protein
LEMVIQRGIPTATSIPGEMFIEGRHVCWTLERADVAIPAGTYQVTLYASPHFERLMPLLNDVPGRSEIEIHWGNFPPDSRGCILVGEAASVDAIWKTQDAFRSLFPAIEGSVRSGEGCWCTIHDPLNNAEQVSDATHGDN